MPTHEHLGTDDGVTFSTDGNHRYSWIKDQAIAVGQADATFHLLPQHNQLISERGVLGFKRAPRLQRRSEQRQQEA
jgi:hypothetical protein